MDVSRLDAVLQFALAAASQEDDRQNRELGPLHLIKYAYLADFAHALKHGGRTFTGAPWRFHKFGPWAVEVFERIEPAAAAVGAERKNIPSAKYEDFVRYFLPDDGGLQRLAAALPGEVASEVRWAVHEFGCDTAGLLDYAYRTKPMLRAAPGEFLVFEGERDEAPLTEPATEKETAVQESFKVRKQRKAALTELRESVRARLRERRARPPAAVTPPPRYDEVFFEGVKWLDGLAGEPVHPTEAEAVFSEDIWKSPTRRGRDVP